MLLFPFRKDFKGVMASRVRGMRHAVVIAKQSELGHVK